MGIDRTLRCIAAVVVLIWLVAPPLIHSWPGWDRPADVSGQPPWAVVASRGWRS